MNIVIINIYCVKLMHELYAHHGGAVLLIQVIIPVLIRIAILIAVSILTWTN